MIVMIVLLILQILLKLTKAKAILLFQLHWFEPNNNESNYQTIQNLYN